jgi:hypothetical protein
MKRGKTIKCATIVCSLLLSAALGTQAYATMPPSGTLDTVALHHSVKKPRPKPHGSGGVVTYNHDSPDPNVGWHWDHGMRECSEDCDNPEIPGSGYTCRNVHLFGMDWRECDKDN